MQITTLVTTNRSVIIRYKDLDLSLSLKPDEKIDDGLIRHGEEAKQRINRMTVMWLRIRTALYQVQGGSAEIVEQKLRAAAALLKTNEPPAQRGGRRIVEVTKVKVGQFILDLHDFEPVFVYNDDLLRHARVVTTRPFVENNMKFFIQNKGLYCLDVCAEGWTFGSAYDSDGILYHVSL